MKKSIQRLADVSTLICMASLVILYFLGTDKHGASALWLIMPALFVGLMHLVLGGFAIIAAVSTRRFFRNIWIYGYFGTVFFVVMSYVGFFRSLQASIKEKIEANQFKHEIALFQSIENNDRSGVESALSAGAAPSHCFIWNPKYRCNSPLQLAVQRQADSVIPALLDAGADIDLACKLAGEKIIQNSLPPIILAVQNLDQNSVKMLLDHGAKLSFPGMHYSVLGMAIAGSNFGLPFQHYEADPYRHRRDMGAVRNVVKMLLVAGAPNDVYQAQATPLHWAVVLGDAVLVDSLLAAGADPNLEEHQHHRRPLELAIIFGKPELAERLLNNVPPAAIDGPPGARALIAAAKQHDTRSVALLLKAGLEVKKIENLEIEKDNPWRLNVCGELYRAFKNGDDGMVDALLQAGVNINCPIQRQRGKVIVELVAGNLQLLQKAVALGADVNARNSAGATAMHGFAQCRYRDDTISAIQNLLQMGADINAKAADGRTPLDIAHQSLQKEMADFLSGLGASKSAGK